MPGNRKGVHQGPVRIGLYGRVDDCGEGVWNRGGSIWVGRHGEGFQKGFDIRV
jgi:hypothetical protein